MNHLNNLILTYFINCIVIFGWWILLIDIWQSQSIKWQLDLCSQFNFESTNFDVIFDPHVYFDFPWIWTVLLLYLSLNVPLDREMAKHKILCNSIKRRMNLFNYWFNFHSHSDDNMDMLNYRRDLVHDSRESAINMNSRSRDMSMEMDTSMRSSSYYG